MAKRNKIDLNSTTPGPGTYNARDDAVKSRSISPNMKASSVRFKE